MKADPKDPDRIAADVLPLERMTKESLESRVSVRLHQLILDGTVPLGSRLREIALAESFGVARGTMRKALFDLMHQGLVVQRPYTGWSVVSMTVDDAKELLTLRSALEMLGVQIAVDRISQGEDAAPLVAAFAAYERDQKEPSEDWIAEELRLVAQVIAFARHGRLAHHFNIVSDQFKVYSIFTHKSSAGHSEALAYARRLGPALLAADGTRAVQIVRGRIDAELERLTADSVNQP